MALTGFQSGILRSLAANRRATAGSYVAGGLALNYRLGEPRQSRDIDIFNDSAEVLLFPRDMAGTCVLDRDGNPFRGDLRQLAAAIEAGDVVFHEGRICGAWPQIIER